jgi:L-ascorbate metabolism protein UlaG (beta-lactamase superfamily)
MKRQIFQGILVFCFAIVNAEFTVAQSLQFSAPLPLTNREVAFRLAMPSNANYRIDATTNLVGLTNADAWQGLLTVPPGPGTLQHTDSATPYLPLRFYRAQQLAGTTALTGDHVATTNGDVVIRPVNHASLVLGWNGLMIYNDPVGSSSLYSSFPRANLILVSHTHGDHYSASTLEAVRAAGTIILAPQAVYNNMGTTLRAVTGVLTNGMTTNVFGIHVEAVPAYNANHPRPTCNGYVVTLGGKRFLFTGDTGDIPELFTLPDIDVAFVCMNLPFTMSITNAATMIRSMRPKVIYPYHYRNGDSTFPDLNDFKRRVGQDLGIEVRFRKWY